MDRNGYPSEDELKMIRNWDILNDGYQGLLEMIRDLWWNGDIGGFIWRGRWLQLHTWGWSGNEDIIMALEHPKHGFGLWQFWRMSKRGGHYWFELSPMFKNRESIEKSKKQGK